MQQKYMQNCNSNSSEIDPLWPFAEKVRKEAKYNW